jgi:SWI2/SNF2 ATPase
MEMELYAHLVALQPKLKNPTVIVVTDRKELDGQLFETFKPLPVAARSADQGAPVSIWNHDPNLDRGRRATRRPKTVRGSRIARTYSCYINRNGELLDRVRRPYQLTSVIAVTA